MKNQSTFVWLALALLLAGFIWICDRHFATEDAAGGRLLPGLHPADITEIHISPAGAKEFTVVRTNNAWRVQRPFVYPAQPTAVAALLAALEKLPVATRITAADLNGKKNAEDGFGFDAPQAAIDLAAGEQQWHFLIGNKTAPGDQVFVRIVGAEGAYVTDAAWLQFLPSKVESWRDTSLAGAVEDCNWIVITNGARVLEFRRNGTNQIWRMLQPLAARADSARLAAALQSLATGQVTRFITDDPKTDLTQFGLDPAAMDVWIGQGTNVTAGVHAGKISAEDTNQIYVRRDRFNSVGLAPKDALAAWSGEVNDFRDPHLLELNAAVTEIEVRGAETNFTLLYTGENGWRVAGEKFAADPEGILSFAKLLAGWRASEFVKDVVTKTDLEKYGLANPAQQITFRFKTPETNHVVAQLLFGNVEADRILVKRADEDFIYALPLKDFKALPQAGWDFRARKLWNFSVTNVASITLRQSGQTRTLVPYGTNSWSLAAGSGTIDPHGVQTAVEELGTLEAAGWIARNFADPETLGFTTNNLQLTITLKSAEKFTLDFGAAEPHTQSAFAAVTLEGERWAFLFPPALYQVVLAYLTIPQADK